MSDDKVYKDGDVVWVKLGNNWWPGEVTGVHRQPDGLIKHLKRKPYCVVKFFQEDAYEYVKSAKQIFPFQCNKKDEFIKKGNALYNAKNKFMEKFPGDVEIAERLTRKTIESDMLIINNRPDSIVKAILGQSLTPRHSNDYYDSEYASNTTGNNKRRSGDSVTKILNITPQRTIATASATNTTDSPNTPASAPARISSFNSANANFYRCNLCDFSSQRQNVMILHRRTHSSGGSTPSAAHTTKTATPKAANAVRQAPSASIVAKVHNASAPSTPLSVSKTTREVGTPPRVRHSLPTYKLDDAATERNKPPAALTRPADTDFACTPLGLPSADTPTNHTSTPWIASDPTSTAGAKRRKKKERARTRCTLRSSPHIDADVSDITLPEAVPYTDTVDEEISDVSSSKTEITVVSALTRAQKQSTKHIQLAVPVSAPATKHKSEEIRQRLLADWSDEEKDEDRQLEGDESKSAGMGVTVEEIDDGLNALETKDVKQEMVTPPLVAVATPTVAGNRIRNIPKKDRRDVVLKDFNSDFTLSNSSSPATSASRTPPLVQIDSTNSNSSTDSVVLVVELSPTEPIDVDAEGTSGETEMETEADIKSEDTNDKLEAVVINPAAAAAVGNEICEAAVDRVDEVVAAQMEQQIVDPAVAAIVEQMEVQTAEKTVEALGVQQVEVLQAPVAPEIEAADTDDMLAAVHEQVEQQLEILHSTEAASVPPVAHTAAISDSETTATSNKSIESANRAAEVDERAHAADIEEPEKQPLAMVAAVATSATATVAAALSCFDFQEEEEDTESDVLKSIANFKKKYTSPDKAQTQTSNAVSEQQRPIAARGSVDGKSIKSPQRLAELEQKDQQLAAEIETLLAQTSATVVDMSAIAAPSTTVVGGTVANKEELPVRGLPIKERGKRIFKSRNRSRLDEQPPPAEPTVEVTAKSVSESAGENAKNDSAVEQLGSHEATATHTELNNGVLAELGTTMAATAVPQLAEPTEESIGNNELKDAEQPQQQPQELASTNVSSNMFEESATACEEPAPHCDEPKINEQSAEEPEELLEEQCALTKVSDAVNIESQPVAVVQSEEVEDINIAIDTKADDTNAPAELEAVPDLQYSANKLNSTQCLLTDVEENANVALLGNEQNIELTAEALREENADTEASRVALTNEDSLCELKDTVDQQAGAEVISRFTSPTDENSSVGISDAGAEFGSPASMLDDERLTLLTSNLLTPTEGLTDTLTPESVESREKCSTEDETVDTAERCEVEEQNDMVVEGNKMDDTQSEQATHSVEQLLEEEAAVKAAAAYKLGAATESDVVAAELAANIEQALAPEPVSAPASVPTPIITVTEPELEEDDDEIESPPHEALSGNEIEAEIEKARKLKMIKTRQSSRRKDKEKAPNIVKEYAEVEMAKIDATTNRLTRSKRTSTTSNSEMEFIAATMESSTLKTQSIRSKRASTTSNSESITSNMESPTSKVECITANVMSTRSKRTSTASNSDSIASIVESPTGKDSPYIRPTRSKRASTASNSDSITSNVEYPTTKGECITPNLISTRSKRASTASNSDSRISLIESPTAKGECITPNVVPTRSKRASTASNSDSIISMESPTAKGESITPNVVPTRSKRASTASNSESTTSNVEHTSTTMELTTPKIVSKRSKRLSTASNSESITSNVEHTSATMELTTPKIVSKRSKSMSTASNSESTTSNVEHTSATMELTTPKIVSKRSKRLSTASNSESITSNVEHTSATMELTTPKIVSKRSKRLSTASNSESTTSNVEHTSATMELTTPKIVSKRSKRLSTASNSESMAVNVEHATMKSTTPKIESKLSKRVSTPSNSESITSNLEHAPLKLESARSKKGSARSKKKSTTSKMGSTTATTPAQPEPVGKAELNSDMPATEIVSPNKSSPNIEVEAPVGRRVTRSSLQNKTPATATAAEFDLPKEDHSKEASTPYTEEVTPKPQQRRSKTTRRLTLTPEKEKVEVAKATDNQTKPEAVLNPVGAAENQQALETVLVEKTLTPHAEGDQKNSEMTQPIETIEKIWTTEPVIVEKPSAPYKPAKERNPGWTPAPDPLSLPLQPVSKATARKRRSSTNVAAAQRRSINDVISVGAEKVHVDEDYLVEPKARKLETAPTTAELQKPSSAAKRSRTATTTKSTKSKAPVVRATAAPDRTNSDLEQLFKSVEHSEEKPDVPQGMEKCEVAPDAVSTPQVEATTKQVAVEQQPEVGHQPNVVDVPQGMEKGEVAPDAVSTLQVEATTKEVAMEQQPEVGHQPKVVDVQQGMEQGEVAPYAVITPQVEDTTKEVAMEQQPEVENQPKVVTSATAAVPIEASPNILGTSQAVTAVATATMTTASEMRLFRPRRKTLSVESAAVEVKLEVSAPTTQRGAPRRKKLETDLRACNANGPSERVNLMPPKLQAASAARTPSPIAMRHINVDVAHPLSSQIANIMAIAGASAEQQQLKRRKSLEDDIPSFIIERRAQASEPQLGSVERDALAHVQSLCPQMKITRKEKRVEPEVAPAIVQQVPLQRPLQQQQQQAQPLCKAPEAGTVFDIDNMPIVLSNEQMLSGMQFVIGAPPASDAAAAACSALPDGPRILQQQILLPARSSPPPLHQSKLPAPQRQRRPSTNQRPQQAQQPQPQCPSNKQIGVDARGNKYVIIKTPPSDLNVQPFQPPSVGASLAAKSPNVAGNFKIGAGVTLRPISEPNAHADSPVPPAQQQQLQLPPPPPPPPPFTKPKSPAAAATGGRKQAGNTITLPSSITVKQQKLNDELGAVDTCAPPLRTPQTTAAADVGNHGSHSKTSRRPPPTGVARKRSQEHVKQPSSSPSPSPAQLSLSQVKVQLQQRQQVQLQPRQVQQRRQTACAEQPPNSSTLTLTRRLSCTDTHLFPPAKIPKRSVGSDVATLVEQQLLQLQQQRKNQATPNTPTSSSPPPLHPLHNRKPRKAPAATHQSPANASVAPSTHPQEGAGGETNMIVEEQQPLVQQNQLIQPAASQQQPQAAGLSTEPPPLVPAYSSTDQLPAPAPASADTDSMALVPHEASQVTATDATSAALVRHRTSTDSNSMAVVPYRTSESMAIVPCQTLVEYDTELEAKMLAVPTIPISKFSDTFRLCTISEDKFIPINELLFQLEKNQLKQVPREEWEDELPELLVQRARLEEWIFLPQLLALHTDGESETCLALICLPPTSSIAAQLQAAEAMEAAAAIEAAAAMEVAADDTEDADVSAEMETLVAVDGVSEGVGASAFLLHSDGHEMIIDAATFAQLLSNPDEQMDVVTQDGEVIRLTRASLLHSMVERAQIAGTAAVEEQLQVPAVADVQQLDGDDGDAGEAESTDIIAVALAGSELYGNEVLEIDTPQALQLMSSDGSIVFQPPVLPQPHLTPPITAHTSETNAVLNQTPIMSTLEKPSTAAGKCQPADLAANMAVTSALLAAGASGLAGCRPNLDDSLAVIGVTTQPSAVPSSLELPITVTNPAIAPKVTMATQCADIVQFHTQCAVSAAIASEPRIYNDPGS